MLNRDSVNKNSRVNEKSSKTKPTFFVFSTPIFWGRVLMSLISRCMSLISKGNIKTKTKNIRCKNDRIKSTPMGVSWTNNGILELTPAQTKATRNIFK